jgi:hypothetical protein
MLVVSDVIPPGVPATMDAVALLRFGSANGFFLAAAWGLARRIFSRYWRLRVQLGLTRYAKTAIIEKLNAAGFETQLAPRISATTKRVALTTQGCGKRRVQQNSRLAGICERPRALLRRQAPPTGTWVRYAPIYRHTIGARETLRSEKEAFSGPLLVRKRAVPLCAPSEPLAL